MTNEEVLKTPDGLLTSLDKQRRFLLRLAVERLPCPVCGLASNQLEAGRIALNDYPFDKTALDFRCPAPGCDVRLEVVVPLFVMGARSWLWRRKEPRDQKTSISGSE